MRRRQHLQHLSLCLGALLAPTLTTLPAHADRYDHEDDGEFLILRARYGTEQRHVDVTERLREVARRDRRVRVTNDLFGIDPDPGRDKLLRIHARDRQGRELRFDIREDDWLDGAQFVGWADGRWGEPGWQGDWQAGSPRDDRHDDGSYTILYATWGLPGREADVTAPLRELARRDLRFKVEVERLGVDPAPGRTKRLHIVARDRRGAERSFDYSEYSWVDGAQFIGWSRGDWGGGDVGPWRGHGLHIESASYGADGRWMDVTPTLRALARDGRLELEVRNELLGGDPAPGRRKTLSITYRRGGEPATTLRVAERDWLRLP